MIQKQIEPMLSEYLHQKACGTNIPLNGTFELTPVCNMNCKMCYVRMSQKEQEEKGRLRTKEEWLQLAKSLRDKGMLFLLLTGGEPFLRKDFKEIYIALHEMGFLISINSNGTLIDEKAVEWLKKYPPTRINITLYGASGETYENLCGYKDGYVRVTHAIDLLKEAGILVKLNGSLTPYNVQDLKELIAYSEKEKLILQMTSYMFPPMRKNGSIHGHNDRFTEKEAVDASVMIQVLQRGKAGFLDYVKQLEKGESKFALSCQENEQGNPLMCRAGKCSFWVTWDWKLLACGMMNNPIEDLTKTSFDEAWNNIVKKTAEIRLPQKCASCQYKDTCQACAAMVYTETGSFEEVPEYRCRMSYMYLDRCRHMVERIEKGEFDE